MECDHNEAEHILPEEGGRKKPLAEHDLFPDGASNHNEIEQRGFGDDGRGRNSVTFAAEQIAQHKTQGDGKDREL